MGYPKQICYSCQSFQRRMIVHISVKVPNNHNLYRPTHIAVWFLCYLMTSYQLQKVFSIECWHLTSNWKWQERNQSWCQYSPE
jgi:hypothetical protein